MITFILTGFGVWAVTMAAWYFLSNFLRSSDTEKIKSRLLGTGKAKGKKAKSPQAALIQAPSGQERYFANRLLRKYKLAGKLQEMIEQSGVKWNPARFMHGCLALFLASFFIAWYGLPPNLRFLAWLIAAGAGCLPYLYLLRLRTARMRKFEEQFPESLEFVARSMRAGHAFSVSLEMIHREFQEPLAGEFRRTFEEHNLGLPLDVALEKLGKRVPMLDVHFFVSAVLLQKRTGGNLAEILDKLAYVIRERFKLRGKIRAISAHGRMTGAALSAIPAVVAFIMCYTNPESIRFFLQDDTGNILMAGAIGLQLIGYAIIKKIVSIEV